MKPCYNLPHYADWPLVLGVCVCFWVVTSFKLCNLPSSTLCTMRQAFTITWPHAIRSWWMQITMWAGSPGFYDQNLAGDGYMQACWRIPQVQGPYTNIKAWWGLHLYPNSDTLPDLDQAYVWNLWHLCRRQNFNWRGWVRGRRGNRKPTWGDAFRWLKIECLPYQKVRCEFISNKQTFDAVEGPTWSCIHHTREKFNLCSQQYFPL